MKRFLLFGSILTIAACGSPPDEEEPIQIITTDNAAENSAQNNGTDENNGDANNGAANNGDANNGGTNSGTNNGAANNGDPNNGELPGLALLGDGGHTPDSVVLTEIVGPNADLTIPRDLAFHPSRDELWIINLGDNSTVVIDDPLGTPQSQRYAGAGKDHFMARPSSLAFGDNGNFATAQEEDEPTQGNLTPADFMGPTLWSSDRTIYDGGHGGHLDMLHNSPNGAGIAWESGNRYWVFDGYHQSVTMYDFHSDHGPGGSDHSDGEVARYVEEEVGYVGDVPSHLEFNQVDKKLYIADTGNNRIATLDTAVGEMGARIQPNYDGGPQYYMNGGVLETWVDGADAMLELPSGLELHDDMVFVSDNKLSRIVALDMDGNVVDYLELATEVQTGGLMGMAFAADGSLFLVDAVDNRILRVAAIDSDGTQ